MKIVVFNVKYSENLGDGLLARCVEAGLTKDAGHIEVETIDLAGREGFGMGGSSGRRQQALKVLHRLPPFARRWAVAHVLGRTLRKLRGQWDAKIAAADAVVIGGGNLFQDDDLNFPLKVGTVLDCVRRHNRPLAIYAVGVSSHWSAPASRLFERLKQTNCVHLSVRDSFAQDSWRQHFPDGPEAKIVHDPGLLTRALDSDDPDSVPSRQPTVGLCVTEPVILQRHASQKASAIPLQDIAEYRDLIRLLVQDGYRISLFCNGASEDQIFAQRIMDEASMQRLAKSGALQLAPRPRVPEELIRILRSTDVILAHRLHACIAAYSLGIPHVGLGWDKKVEGFFRSVGRQSYFANGSGTSVSDIAGLLKAAHSEGIESFRHRVILAEAEAGIVDMRRNLTQRDQNNVAEMSSVIRKDQRAAATN
ncbi:polysaccharide pyruvyl transferase family protein [Rhizobium leucaenae]|uniref:Polysaccharide pyruvyl transferase WcaK-like protein n=1 Tax=Rhizobium leucaenae TaxID=29450 RepID=A0A7W7EJ84_9HYPH|nr:polysaccharide pyruvyl transferase family protein [Rhizobium leucaenae]MBB4567179.1 polysaccharide pyruvyl transferase WcaK-like protein [Rhizobium leucaenae]MBB6304597.1 polysaccharide pyruvyl transferase WcaK-like protein [Rhizobium leucaenae]